MTISWNTPTVLATQAGPNVAASLLDANWAAAVTALSGLVAAMTDLPLSVNATGTRAWAQGAAIADAAAITLGSDGNYFVCNGTTTVTSISTKQAGCIVILRFAGARTLTHNATTLILMGATNATTASGDLYWFISEGGGNWREIWRRPVTGASSANAFLGNGTWGAPTASTILTRTVTPVTVTSTSSETDLFSYTVPENTLSTNRLIRVTLLGSMLNNVGTAQVCQISMKYGATTFFDGVTGTPYTSLTSSATPHPLKIVADLSARNATNAQIGYGEVDISLVAGLSGTVNALVSTAGAAAGNAYRGVHTTMAEDSTGALALKITATPTTNSASLSVTATVVQVELI